MRVALIGTRHDLGAVPVLFGKPQRYADFLGQELVYFWKGPTLVVMPNGYGIYQNGKPLDGGQGGARQAAAAGLDRRRRARRLGRERRAALAQPARDHAPETQAGVELELVEQPRPRRARRRRDPALRARVRRPAAARPAAGAADAA